VWDAAFETLASLGPPADEEHAVDTTIVQAHQFAAKREPKSRSARALAWRLALRAPSNCIFEQAAETLTSSAGMTTIIAAILLRSAESNPVSLQFLDYSTSRS
jgi:hypothetical protein